MIKQTLRSCAPGGRVAHPCDSRQHACGVSCSEDVRECTCSNPSLEHTTHDTRHIFFHFCPCREFTKVSKAWLKRVFFTQSIHESRGSEDPGRSPSSLLLVCPAAPMYRPLETMLILEVLYKRHRRAGRQAASRQVLRRQAGRQVDADPGKRVEGRWQSWCGLMML